MDYILDGYEFDAITFNNGLHSLNTNKKEWETAYRSAVDFLMAKKPNAKLFLTLSTPVENLEANEKCIEVNLPVKAVAEEKSLPIIDLYTPLKDIENEKPWSDGVHFKDEYVEFQAQIIEKHIREALNLQ